MQPARLLGLVWILAGVGTVADVLYVAAGVVVLLACLLAPWLFGPRR